MRLRVRRLTELLDRGGLHFLGHPFAPYRTSIGATSSRGTPQCSSPMAERMHRVLEPPDGHARPTRPRRRQAALPRRSARAGGRAQPHPFQGRGGVQMVRRPDASALKAVGAEVGWMGAHVKSFLGEPRAEELLVVRYPNQRRFFALALNPYYMLVANPQRMKAVRKFEASFTHSPDSLDGLRAQQVAARRALPRSARCRSEHRRIGGRTARVPEPRNLADRDQQAPASGQHQSTRVQANRPLSVRGRAELRSGDAVGRVGSAPGGRRRGIGSALSTCAEKERPACWAWEADSLARR